MKRIIKGMDTWTENGKTLKIRPIDLHVVYGKCIDGLLTYKGA
jgi:hypothetical protein